MPSGARQPTSQVQVFISYSRKDGASAAAHLRARLQHQHPEIAIWQDVVALEGGRGWWAQITEALESCHCMILIMTPASVQSEFVIKEWRYARQHGVSVCPVIGSSSNELDFQSLPSWMRKIQFFDPERDFDRLVMQLKSPMQASRVPFMAPDLPDKFVQRNRELDAVLAQLLDGRRQNAKPSKVAILGAGGYGKTTLAAAVAHHDDIVDAFDDGILWVTLGEKPSVLDALTKLYCAVTGQLTAGFRDVEEASQYLNERLRDKDCLIVLDDAWDGSHVRPFLHCGNRAGHLVTTRSLPIAAELKQIHVDRMLSDESVALLLSGTNPAPVDAAQFATLAARLGYWPLLLELAGAAFRQRLARGDTVAGALSYLNRALDVHGVVAFDQRNDTERSKAVSRTIDVTLQMLSGGDRELCQRLAIFPEEVDVPLTAASALSGLDDFATEELIQRLDDFALMRYSPATGCFRIHDVIRGYLLGSMRDPATVHALLLDAWPAPPRLPDDYAWRYHSYHLYHAKRTGQLRAHLFDYSYLRAKLGHTDPASLIADFYLIEREKDSDIVQSALRLSSHVLGADSAQLGPQLIGRLLDQESAAIRALVDQCREAQHPPCLYPVSATLASPGGPLLFKIPAHLRRITAVALSPDGRRAVSASDDQTIKVWDLASGRNTRTLACDGRVASALAFTVDGRKLLVGWADWSIQIWDVEQDKNWQLGWHNGGINALVATPDGRHAISASRDRTLGIWDLQELREGGTLQGHTNWVNAVAVSADGSQAVSGSSDGLLKVWDLKSQSVLLSLEGHTDAVNSVALIPKEHCAVSGADDHTLRLWDLASGREIRRFDGHGGPVRSVVVSADAKRIISASDDSTIRIWDAHSAAQLALVEGHKEAVTALALATDGVQAISGSADANLMIWDFTSRQPGAAAGHSAAVTAVTISPDCSFAVSGSEDLSIKIWCLRSGRQMATLYGHTSAIRGLIVTPNSRRLISVASDTGRLWDLVEGKEKSAFAVATARVFAATSDWRRAAADEGNLIICSEGDSRWICKGHTARVLGLAFTPDGRKIVSTSWDSTMRVWEFETGRELRKLETGRHGASAVDITPDGKYVLSASADHSMKMWDLESGALLQKLVGHTHAINAIAVFANGQHAVTASEDATVRIWDLAAAKDIVTFHADKDCRCCAVSADGSMVVAGDQMGRVHLLRVML